MTGGVLLRLFHRKPTHTHTNDGVLSFRAASSLGLCPTSAELQVESQLVTDVWPTLDDDVEETVSVGVKNDLLTDSSHFDTGNIFTLQNLTESSEVSVTTCGAATCTWTQAVVL